MKLKYFMITLLLVVMSSCNSEDDTSSFNDSSLNGTIYEGNLRLNSQSQLELYGELGITKVTGTLYITSQSSEGAVNDLTSLNSIMEVGSLEIEDNPILERLEGLENIQTDRVYIADNELLENINALDLSSIPLSYLALINLPNLNDFSSLSNVEEIGTFLFQRLPLTNLESLSNLKRIGTFSLSNMDNLENLESLNLEYITNVLAITWNDNLQSLEGLESIQEVGQYCEVTIRSNPMLTDFCYLTAFTQQQDVENSYTVYDNEFNPTFQDLLDGNCN
ncbi:hypothetical protein [uncultured Dokdonia sp.]|uniref:hypothetical protein n=1 Tax=uncultured Dokdonia sp. TaxID=575653 RepID=UPI002613617C|nr:hypothetical protein [uncultured Dokdonia sp.]